MTREELQQKLRELEEMKEAEMRLHESNLCDINEKQREELAAVEDRKHIFMHKIAGERREIDSRMRHAVCEEQVRYKTENMRIENKRQQLFADYKAQANDNEKE